MAGKKYTVEINLDVKGEKELSNVVKAVDEVTKKGGAASNTFIKIGSGVKKAGLAVKGFGVSVKAAFGGAVFAIVTRIIDAFVQMEPVTKAMEYAFKFIEVAVSKAGEAFQALLSLDFGKFWDIAKGIKATTDSIVDLEKAIEGLNTSMAAMEVRMGNLNFIAGLHKTAVDDTTRSYRSRLEQAGLWYEQLKKNNTETVLLLEHEKELYLNQANLATNEKDRTEAAAKVLQLQRQINDVTQSGVEITAQYNEVVKTLREEEQSRLEGLRDGEDIEVMRSHSMQVVDIKNEEVKLLKKANQQIVRDEKQTWLMKNQATIAGAQLGLAALGSALTMAASLSEDNFEQQKKFQIAAATVNTISGAVGAFVNAFVSIPNPIAAAVIGGLMAATVLTAGYLQIDQIRNQQPNGGGGGGSSGSFSAAATPSIPDAGSPNFALINPLDSGSQAIGSSIQNNNEPMKAYVVSGDMTSQQELDRNILSNATI